jgi:hypothetical protein
MSAQTLGWAPQTVPSPGSLGAEQRPWPSQTGAEGPHMELSGNPHGVPLGAAVNTHAPLALQLPAVHPALTQEFPALLLPWHTPLAPQMPLATQALLQLVPSGLAGTARHFPSPWHTPLAHGPTQLAPHSAPTLTS